MTNKELLNDETLIVNAGYAATIAQLNLIIKAKDMRIAELEAMINTGVRFEEVGCEK